MNRVKLGYLTEKAATWNPRVFPDEPFSYIDLSAVDNKLKSVGGVVEATGADAPSRARQKVHSGDVLVSTVRPNLNAVAVVPPDFDGATASTGFSVLRANAELHNRYLFHWVRSSSFIDDMCLKATGASYPAVSDKIVKESTIPLPPLDEQRRIAAILDQADTIRAKRQELLHKIVELPYSIFRHSFGESREWGQRWGLTTIGDLAESVQYGSSAKSGDSGEWPILRMGNLTDDAQLNLDDMKFVDLVERDVPKYTVRRGDMLFNRTNSREKVGKAVAIHTDAPLAFAGYLVRVRFATSAYSDFVATFLTSGHGRAVRQGMAKSAVNQANINATEMRGIHLPNVPSSEVVRFADQLATIRDRKAAVEKALERDEALFASLQDRAFKGEL